MQTRFKLEPSGAGGDGEELNRRLSSLSDEFALRTPGPWLPVEAELLGAPTQLPYATLPFLELAAQRKNRRVPASRARKVGEVLVRVPWAAITLLLISLTGLAYMVWMLARAGGALTFTLASLAACLPAILVVGVFLFMSQRLPLPRGYLALAFLWGGGAATSLALLGNSAAQEAFVNFDFGPSPFAQESATAVVVAPFLEEATKGLGVLLVLILARRYLVSPLGGVVVAGVTAGGFAFVENVLYFVRFADIMPGVFFVRGVLGPFGHSLYTSFTGLAVALAYTRLRRRGWLVPLGLLGYLSAVFLHGLWNGLASYDGLVFLGSYFGWWIPFFGVWLALTLGAAAMQGRAQARGLDLFVGLGWVSADFARLLRSPLARALYRYRLSRLSRRSARLTAQIWRHTGHLALGYVAVSYAGPKKSLVRGMYDAQRQLGRLNRQLQAEYEKRWERAVGRRKAYVARRLLRLSGRWGYGSGLSGRF